MGGVWVENLQKYPQNKDVSESCHFSGTLNKSFITEQDTFQIWILFIFSALNYKEKQINKQEPSYLQMEDREQLNGHNHHFVEWESPLRPWLRARVVFSDVVGWVGS